MEERIKRSKHLAYLLRHSNMERDSYGWSSIDTVLRLMGINRTELDEIVHLDEKRRYEIQDDKIRACQGHTVPVENDMQMVEDITYLYHGTLKKYLSSIMEKGIFKMNRNYVHLSSTKEVAWEVASRRPFDIPVVILVDAAQMIHDGIEIYISNNEVYLTDYIPVKYLIDVFYRE